MYLQFNLYFFSVIFDKKRLQADMFEAFVKTNIMV